MSELRLETLTMPTADVGPVEPVAAAVLRRPTCTRSSTLARPTPRCDTTSATAGSARCCRTSLQDGYGRDRQPTGHQVAVLENDVLRATFLLDRGGRLWSLVHKPTGRELLHRNPVFQPANLALRNAWFAGGVEWNIGTIGHSPTTCEPLHAARVLQPDGTPVLRMYEFERLREVVFQVDAWLPEGSAVLLVHVRIVNPNDVETPMYWWSNIAVPQADDVRVLAPADDGLAVRLRPARCGGCRSRSSTDRTARTPPARPRPPTTSSRSTTTSGAGSQPWTAGAPGWCRPPPTGSAAASCSCGARARAATTGRSGSRSPVTEYLEIQAGLARTQLEHLPMPGRASWSWVEAYGLLQSDADAVHGDDWSLARAAVSRDLEELIPRAELDRVLARRDGWADAAPVEVLNRGSGWGALERRLRERDGDDSLSLPGTPFGDETLGPEQERLARAAADRPDAVAAGSPATVVVPDEPPVAAAARGGRRLAGHAAPRGGPRPAPGTSRGRPTRGCRPLAAEPTAWAWRNLAAAGAGRRRPAAGGRRYQARGLAARRPARR